MANAEQSGQASRWGLFIADTRLFVGNVEETMEWYKRLGFEPEYHSSAIAFLSRDSMKISLQQQAGDIRAEACIHTNDVKALYEEYSALPGVEIARPLTLHSGKMEFDLIDPNGHRLVFRG